MILFYFQLLNMYLFHIKLFNNSVLSICGRHALIQSNFVTTYIIESRSIKVADGSLVVAIPFDCTKSYHSTFCMRLHVNPKTPASTIPIPHMILIREYVEVLAEIMMEQPSKSGAFSKSFFKSSSVHSLGMQVAPSGCVTD